MAFIIQGFFFFENVENEYSTKSSAVKDTYTNFFEGVSDVVSVTVEGVWNFIKGVGVAVYEIAEGLISLVIDAGIIAISNNIPDFIEPEFLKKAANTRVETFAGMLEQIIDDPIIILESVAQSLSDTSEKEGIMYVTGGAATSLIPYVGQSKYLKLLKVEKDKATNTKAVNPAIAQKVKEIVQNNKVFEGFKKETVEVYKGVKNGGTQFVDDVTHFLGRTLFPNQSLQVSTANSVPVNVFSRSTVEDRIDSVVSRASVKVEEKGIGDDTNGTGNDSPSEIAQSWQGNFPYVGVDKYRNITLKKGKVIYVGEPYPTGYATTKSAVNRIKGDSRKLFEGLQVKPYWEDGMAAAEYRSKMMAYEIIEDRNVAYGVTKANPQFGDGGLPQMFIPDFNELVKTGKIKKIESEAIDLNNYRMHLDDYNKMMDVLEELK